MLCQSNYTLQHIVCFRHNKPYSIQHSSEIIRTIPYTFISMLILKQISVSFLWKIYLGIFYFFRTLLKTKLLLNRKLIPSFHEWTEEWDCLKHGCIMSASMKIYLLKVACQWIWVIFFATLTFLQFCILLCGCDEQISRVLLLCTSYLYKSYIFCKYTWKSWTIDTWRLGDYCT